MRNEKRVVRQKLILRGTEDVPDEEGATCLTGEFVRGPILVGWLKDVQTQCGAGYAGVILHHFRTLRGEPFKISHKDWQRFGVDHQAGRRWLHRLASGGYIDLKTAKGQSPWIWIIGKTDP